MQEKLAAGQHTHQTVAMMPPFYQRDEDPAAIDRGLAKVIAQLWALGSTTTGACEDQDGLAYISFEDAESAEMFLEVVAHHVRPERPELVDHESLYNRIAGFSETEPEDWQAYRKRRMCA